MPNIFDPSEQVPGPYQLLVNKYPTILDARQEDPSDYAKSRGNRDARLQNNAALLNYAEQAGYTGSTALKDFGKSIQDDANASYASMNPAQNTTVSNYPSFEQASEYINPVVTREGDTVLVNRYGMAPDGTTPVAGDTGTGMGMGTTVTTSGTVTTGGTGKVGETADQKATRSGLEEFTDILTRAGLAGTKDSFGKTLIDYINEGIKNDEGISTIKNTIRDSEAYKLRFPGMAALQKRNIAVNEGTYIELERGYIETLVAHGLDPSVLATTKQMGDYISLNVNPRVFEKRVTLAADRVKNNPDVMKALSSYYPTITNETAMTYLLNPTVGIDVAEKQVRTAELGAAAQAASKQLFSSINADQLGSMIPDVEGQTYGQLKSSFGQAATLAETQRTMAEIEGDKNYSNLQAVEAQVQGKQTAITESQKRAQRAQARFGGSSGIDRNSLSSATNTI